MAIVTTLTSPLVLRVVSVGHQQPKAADLRTITVAVMVGTVDTHPLPQLARTTRSVLAIGPVRAVMTTTMPHAHNAESVALRRLNLLSSLLAELHPEVTESFPPPVAHRQDTALVVTKVMLLVVLEVMGL